MNSKIKRKAFSKRYLLLLTTNLIFVALLAAIMLRENYPQRIYNRFFSLTSPAKESTYLNERYRIFIDLYSIYQGEKDIVMLGNSLTAGVDWSELLNRPDIANRGIGGDITEGFIHRISYIFNLNPKICFIEGGVNDIAINIPNETIIKNFRILADTMKSRDIKPVLTTVTYVTKKSRLSYKRHKITELNQLIYHLAKEKNIAVIDLNPQISEGDFLKPEYAVSDGLHFNGKTYSIWKNEVEKILQQEGLQIVEQESEI
jgi:lysophospholipase L1-like esterase